MKAYSLIMILAVLVVPYCHTSGATRMLPESTAQTDYLDIYVQKERALHARVAALESIVARLQVRLDALDGAGTGPGSTAAAKPKEKKVYSYYINTPFNGTFYGEGSSKTQAKARTMQACEKKASPTHCGPNKLRSAD